MSHLIHVGWSKAKHLHLRSTATQLPVAIGSAVDPAKSSPQEAPWSVEPPYAARHVWIPPAWLQSSPGCPIRRRYGHRADPRNSAIQGMTCGPGSEVRVRDSCAAGDSGAQGRCPFPRVARNIAPVQVIQLSLGPR
jgi:hypothetical protein